MLIIGLFILGIASRLTPHTANFSPIIAIALFSGAYLNRKHYLWVPITLYVISDLIVGLHGIVLFTWGSVFLITLLGRKLKSGKNFKNTLAYTLLSSILFFLITNFGVWVSGWYPQTLAGFIKCYTLAIPFFRTSLIANLFYMTVLISVYELVTRKVANPKIKLVLLSN